MANLDDVAGKVSATLHAESMKGLDRSKLRTAYLESLKGADLVE